MYFFNFRNVPNFGNIPNFRNNPNFGNFPNLRYLPNFGATLDNISNFKSTFLTSLIFNLILLTLSTSPTFKLLFKLQTN